MKIRTACLVALVAVSASCRNNEGDRDYSIFEPDLSDQVTVGVSGRGAGSGVVRSREQIVAIG
ncbi:MAG: hypothetical protein H7099_18175 [Gemmatimonadaceae bacterium]|nr:hypothetical protein [Gemmatimonadaceae bacterium]